MSKKKPIPASRANKKAEVSLVRSSAAEYLTFVAAGGDSDASVEMRYEDENIWLTQRMMAELYAVSVPAMNQHLKRLFSDNELQPEATVKKYLIVQTGGQPLLEHNYLQAMIANENRLEERLMASSNPALSFSSSSSATKGPGTLTNALGCHSFRR